MKLNARELGAVLAGLRLLRRFEAGDNIDDNLIDGILTDAGEPLTADELDELCERLNCPELEADEQVTAEEAIAGLIFDAQGEQPDGMLGEEECAALGRSILKYTLTQFRPELFDAGGYYR